MSDTLIADELDDLIGNIADQTGLPVLPDPPSPESPPEPTPAEAEAMQDAEFGGPSGGDFVPFVADQQLLGLPDDAPGDDRSDRALMDRSEHIENSLAIDWLVGGAGVATHDVGMGLVETPRQIIGGARDAAQAALNAIDSAGDTLAHFAAKIGLEDPERAAQLAEERNVPLLPEVGEPTTVTGSVVRNVSQFLTGFATAGQFLRVGGVGGAMAKGAVSDFGFFEGQEENLSNWIQDTPLANPVNEFLATDPDDNEALNRFKRSVEGAGLGALTEGFVHAVRSLRTARHAPSAQAQARTVQALEPETVAAKPLTLLGPDDAPLTVTPDRRPPSLAEIETGVPDDVAAKSLTEGLTPLGDGDVFINFARIEGPDDIKQVMRDVASAMKPEVDEAARGVRSHATTKAAAEGLDPFDVVFSRRLGQPLSAEESVAARTLWTAAADKLQQVAATAADSPSPENLFQFRRMMATFHAIQKEVIGARTETARALNSWRIPVGGDRQKMVAMESILNQFGGADVSIEMARKIASMPDKAVIGEFVEKSTFARTADAVHEYWINSILSGPQTHLVNMLSNTGIIGLDLSEHAIAARLGLLLGTENAVEVGEAMARTHGMIAGFKDALRNVAKAWRTGQTGWGVNKVEGARTRAISSTAWNLRSDSWQGRAVDAIGALFNMPGRALGAEDEFFKSLAYRASLHSQAYRQMQKEIREGVLTKADAKARYAELIANPSEAVSLNAATEAAYKTFTSEPGPVVRWLASGRNKVPALRYIVPFVNTPANILKFTFERTPLALTSARIRNAIAKGGAEGDLAMTKMALGTMTMMLALDMSLNGQITGSGPSNHAERALLMRTGWRPNSVKVGDRYFAYNRLDPLGAQLGVAAEFGEFLVNSGELDDEEIENLSRAFAATVFSAAETATSKTYLQGLANLIGAVNDPDQYALAYAKRFAGGFVPNIVRSATLAGDPVPKYTIGIIDEMKSRIPGFADDLPPRRDLWGREIRWESDLGRAFDIVSPIYGSAYQPEPIDEEMRRDGWALGNPGSAFSYNKTPVRLRDRPEAYSRLLQLQGATKPSAMGEAGEELKAEYGDDDLLTTLNSIVTGKHALSVEYRALADAEAREGFIRGVAGDYRRAAKDVLIAEFPDLIQ